MAPLAATLAVKPSGKKVAPRSGWRDQFKVPVSVGVVPVPKASVPLNCEFFRAAQISIAATSPAPPSTERV